MMILRPIGFRAIGWWIFMFVMSVNAVAVRDPVVDDDFDFRRQTGIPFVSGSSIGDYTGWFLVEGEATISRAEASSGAQSLHLKSGSPVTRVVWMMSDMEVNAERIWVQLRMRPTLGDVSETRMALSIFGAKLAFPTGGKEARQSWMREVLAFDTTSGTAVPLDLAVGAGEWVHLLVEIRPGEWRLHDPGGTISDWMGFDREHSRSIHWFGDPEEEIFIDDVRVTLSDPSENLLLAPWNREWGFTTEPLVLSATYGSGGNHVDVTDRVLELLREPDDFFARPQWLRKDPTPGWNKELRITYRYGNRQHTFRTGEGGRVNLEILKAQADE